MTEARQNELALLIEKRLNKSLTEAEFAELETELLKNADARALFLDLSHQHASLQMLEESLVQEQLRKPELAQLSWGKIAAVAAILAVGFISWTQFSKPKIVATLVSSENAAWESSLPTEEGSELTAGFLRLKTGVATVQFQSGANVLLEAPAHLVLETPMKGTLLAGTAVIDVPESAIGFIIETPDGYAVDHGTQFSVSVDDSQRKSSFEVLSGEISVHHPSTGTEVRMTEQQMTSASASGLETLEGPFGEEQVVNKSATKIRIGTEGRATSVIENDSRLEHLHPDMLMVKLPENHRGYERNALFSFNISELDLQSMKSARIRLNQVPSGMGSAAQLPEMNRFAIYGLTDESKEKWAQGSSWENAPTIAAGKLLGKFEIPRSQKTGSYGIETEALFEFLKADSNGITSFILVRETTETGSKGLVHAFATDSHPEASGPVLEFTP